MFDEAAEIQLVPGGATIRVLRSWAAGASEGRRIAANEAAANAEVLLSGSAASFGFRELVQRLRADALDDAGGVRVEDVTPGRCWFELTDVPRTPG